MTTAPCDYSLIAIPDEFVASVAGGEFRYQRDTPERRAAPELLAACKALLEFWDIGTPIHAGAEVVADLRAVIAKAEGQESRP
jgi:hypothetical protein